MKHCFRAVCLILLASAASLSAVENQTVRLGILNGPSGIPCAYLIENKDKLSVQNLSFETFASAQTELPKLLKGEIDVGFLPPNVAAKVFTAGNGAVVALGVAGNGNLYLISKDSSYSSLADLKNKTVVCAGQGATPEYIFKYILAANAIPFGEEADSVHLDFSVPNASIAPAVIAGKAEYALVPEPFATVAVMKSSSVRRIENIQSIFSELNGGATFPMTLLVARADFADTNRAVLERLIEEYKLASQWTVKNPEKAGLLVEKHNLGLQRAVAAKSIATASYTWKDASHARPEIESLLRLFLQYAPESVGGTLPSETFYFKRQ